MKSSDLARLFFLAALWGSTALFNRVAAQDFNTVSIVGWRMLIAVFVLVGWSALRGQLPDIRKYGLPLFVMGLINAVLPIGLAVVASLLLPTGFASILFAPTPLFAALVARAWLKDQLTARQLAGLVIGILGVVVLVGLEPLPMTANTLIGILAALTSCVLYAVATSFVRKFLGGQTPLQVTTGQTMGSALVMLPLTLANLPDRVPGLSSIAVLVLFGVVSTAIGFLMVFQLLSRVGPTNSQTIALLIPCFGVIWGALFRAEPVYASTVAGLVIVLISVSMVTGLDRAVLKRLKPSSQPG